MKLLSKILLFALLLLGSWGCNEDIVVEPTRYGAVSGQVVDKKTGRAISKAVIRLGSGRITKTDTTGHFRVDTVEVGDYTIQATKEGYQDRSETVRVTNGVATTTLIYLSYNDRLPTEPMLVKPTTDAATVPTTVTLKWKSTDPDNDALTYDITLIREGRKGELQEFTGIKADSLVIKGLQYGTTYTWHVKVSDGSNAVNGKVWQFRTKEFPDFAYVYVRNVNGRYQIFTSNGSDEEVQLTTEGSNWRPVVSPDRKRIAFISNIHTDPHLFVMNSDGSNLHRVSPKAQPIPDIAGLKALDLSFCWSPDGTQLLYPHNNQLYVVGIDGNGLRLVSQLANGNFFAGCDWTSQSNRIAARLTSYSVYDSRILLMSPNGKDTTTVYRRETNRMSNPVFSIDGTKLLFACDTSTYQDSQGRQLDSQLLLLDIAKRAATNLSVSKSNSSGHKEAGTNDLEPRFSPNGAKIIFTNTDNTGTGHSQIMSMDADGDNRKVLIQKAAMPYWR